MVSDHGAVWRSTMLRLTVCSWGLAGAALIMPGSRVRVPPLLCPRTGGVLFWDSVFGWERLMWWISYRGEGKTGVENIGVFEDDGAPREQHPLLLDPARPLRLARGFALVGDDLYIANAWHQDSYVARYHREGNTFHFAELVVTTKNVAAMVHPFDVDLGDDGWVYISSQDTNTVIAIVPHSRKPAPVAAHLRRKFAGGHFFPGTVVASSKGRLPEVGEHAPRNVPVPQGLEVVCDGQGKPRRSVRGIVVHRNLFMWRTKRVIASRSSMCRRDGWQRGSKGRS